MDIDFHYYATYALARAAGLRADCAHVIATAAEFVDDSIFREVIGKFGFQGGLVANFRTEIASIVGEETTGALGHGAVATFPDQPYLEWQYSYELVAHAGAGHIERQNANDYMEGAEALHGMFASFAERRGIYTDWAGRDFASIRAAVQGLAGTIAPADRRIAAWKRAMADGAFSKTGEDIPDYDHLAWRKQTEGLKDLPDPQMASGVRAYQFHYAAAIHREYVLRQLLPKWASTSCKPKRLALSPPSVHRSCSSGRRERVRFCAARVRRGLPRR